MTCRLSRNPPQPPSTRGPSRSLERLILPPRNLSLSLGLRTRQHTPTRRHLSVPYHLKPRLQTTHPQSLGPSLPSNHAPMRNPSPRPTTRASFQASLP